LLLTTRIQPIQNTDLSAIRVAESVVWDFVLWKFEFVWDFGFGAWDFSVFCPPALSAGRCFSGHFLPE
jgi:hypothetical protein